jgi:hypothetical protein
LRSSDPAAIFALETSFLAFLSMPFDLLLQLKEKKLYKKATKPKLPLIFVTGAARSGTTLVAQVLIENLPVAYFNNLTAVFQRSPIAANLLFKNLLKAGGASYHSYYGKTTRFSGPNDGLHIWDRWLGKDRTHIPTFIKDHAKNDMIQFFGAFQEAYQKPLINKNNNLSTFAHLITEVFENSYFICVKRNPIYHAQSLLKARMTIHGNENIAYGLYPPEKTKNSIKNLDPIRDVCEQVLFHEQIIRSQQKRIGNHQFWIISYEEFCEKPQILVHKVSEKIPHQSIGMDKLTAVLKPFQNANKKRIKDELFEKIVATYHTLKRCNIKEGNYESCRTDGDFT